MKQPRKEMISILLPKRHQPRVQQVLTRFNRIDLGRRQAHSAGCPLLLCELELWDRGTSITTSFHPLPDGICRVMDTKLVPALSYSSELQASFSHLSFLHFVLSIRAGAYTQSTFAEASLALSLKKPRSTWFPTHSLSQGAPSPGSQHSQHQKLEPGSSPRVLSALVIS